jgi:hypothetical protein
LRRVGNEEQGEGGSWRAATRLSGCDSVDTSIVWRIGRRPTIEEARREWERPAEMRRWWGKEQDEVSLCEGGSSTRGTYRGSVTRLVSSLVDLRRRSENRVVERRRGGRRGDSRSYHSL